MKRTDRGGSVGGAETHTLESLIEQLHAEGVEAGRVEAARLRAAAEQEAAAILRKAEEDGRRLVAEAQARAESLAAQGRAELALAARDALLELRTKLGLALTRLVRDAVERELDGELVRELVREVVTAYARSDAAGEDLLEVRVRPELVEALRSASAGSLARALDDGPAAVDVKGSLSGAGFEYRVRGGVVEVTPESVTEKLAALVTPRLRAVLLEAAGESARELVPAGEESAAGSWTGRETHVRAER